MDLYKDIAALEELDGKTKTGRKNRPDYKAWQEKQFNSHNEINKHYSPTWVNKFNVGLGKIP